MDQEIERVYGGKVRVRACGLCWKDDTLLLVNHHHLGPNHFWAPPGGGIELWRSAEQSLKQEFLEETGLEINVGEFQFAAEFIQAPLHAIELFFPVTIVGGSMKKGHDPETKLQLIKEVGFKSFDTIHSLPTPYKHGIFNSAHTPSDLRNLRGYIRLL